MKPQTPRTDAAWFDWTAVCRGASPPMPAHVVPADFARTLESELAAADAREENALAVITALNERLQTAERALAERDVELRGEQAICGALQILLNRHEQALRIIAGEQQCIDNLMGDKDIARAALNPSSEVNVPEGYSKGECYAAKSGTP